MKLSMGPALALGLESRHEVFDAEGIAPFPADAATLIAAKLPAGISILEGPRARARRAVARQGRQGRALHGAPRLPRTR